MNVGNYTNTFSLHPLTTTEFFADLHQAVTACDVARVHDLLQNSADPFVQDPKSGNTAFHIAAALPTADILAVLCSRLGIYSNLEQRNIDNETALYIAASVGNTEGCKLLIEHGAFRNALCGDFNMRPLHIAASKGNSAVIELFFDTPIDVKMSKGYTAFYMACDAGNEQAARTLLALGANPWLYAGNSGWTPLHLAARRGHASIIRLFEGLNTSVDVLTEDGRTPFHMACQKGHLEAACELLALGADPKMLCNRNETALHMASCWDNREIIDLLRHNNELLEAKNDNNETALCIAASRGHCEIVSMLLDAGANPNVIFGSNKETPLHIAAYRGYVDVIRCFRGRAVVADAYDNDKETPFILACLRGNLEAAQELIAMGAKVDQLLEETSETALHMVAYNGHANIICLFIGRIDIIDVKNNRGNSALHIAASNGHVQFVHVMLEHGASIRTLPDCPLSYSREVIDVFLEQQRKKLNGCCKKCTQQVCVDEVVDLLIDQRLLIAYFARTLKMDSHELSKVMNQSASMDIEVFHRAYDGLGVHRQRDTSRLYNYEQCRTLLEYLYHADLGEDSQDILFSEPFALHETTVVSFLAALEQDVDVSRPTAKLKRLYSIFYEKYSKALSMQSSVYKTLASTSSVEIYPLTDEQFKVAPIYELLTRRYGLKNVEIKSRNYINTGLLSGEDLCCIGIDNGFYHAEKEHVINSVTSRIKALELWQKRYPEHQERLSYLIDCLDKMKLKILSEGSLEDLEQAFAQITLYEGPSIKMLLYMFDQQSAIAILHLYITKKEHIIARQLSATYSTSLAEYVGKMGGHPFIPQYI